MLRLFRFCVMMLLAFVGGIMFERAHQRDLCEDSGGDWMGVGICGVR
ncbi:hypothetical protein [Paracoccus seriniphilus]|nr:hypothetical protein [Paracoccus seriniphilus]WCR14598.1 hypothetical protein JHW44_03835 [Paracoccus seriniphilus]